MTRCITVNLHKQSYPIYIGHDFFTDRHRWDEHLSLDDVYLLTNETVAPLYLDALKKSLEPRVVHVFVLPDGEAYKTWEQLTPIYDFLIQNQAGRSSVLMALGGGVVSDMGGMVASTYLRGIPFIPLPTTLLAQVDASVGGKTAVNHVQGKNLIGSFYQPSAVFINLTTLETLPLRELRAGFAEVIKYALLTGGDFLSELTELALGGLHRISKEDMLRLVVKCVQVKAQFVESDERETGCRVLLNLGHTFAHALETVTQYQRFLHGEAVAIGLYCAAWLSYDLGRLTHEALNQVEALIQACELPSKIPADLDLEALFLALFRDKKVKNKRLRVIVMNGLGDCVLDEFVSDASLKKTLQNACSIMKFS